jgi:putative radical SAM enzyme (TIGR03279 family)
MSSLPRVVAVAPGSPAARAGIEVGDELVSINGASPRDIIQYQLMIDEDELDLELRRGGLDFAMEISKVGEALGIEVHSAVFDRIRTCDNHCEFCFIYQLPKGMRRSLYTKDDDYRLSFLYGNFTTLTRFTEADLERVITENLSPLYVSIHSTDREVRTRMLRNPRGASSLRWLRALLDHGITVHGQVVVCPGINDGDVLDDTLAGVLDEYPDLESVAVVPLGISQFSKEAAMRSHTLAEAQRVVDVVEHWQEVFLGAVGRRMVFASDEYYLLAERPFPEAETYEGFKMHEDGIGMARAFELEATGQSSEGIGVQSGFFASVDAPAEGYRAQRVAPAAGGLLTLMPRRNAPVGILTGTYGARVLEPLVPGLASESGTAVRLLPVKNEFFGGNIGVTGLMVGEDIARVLAGEPEGHRYLLPDVCLSGGKFLDGLTPADLPRPVEIVPTDGVSLRKAVFGELK